MFLPVPMALRIEVWRRRGRKDTEGFYLHIMEVNPTESGVIIRVDAGPRKFSCQCFAYFVIAFLPPLGGDGTDCNL